MVTPLLKELMPKTHTLASPLVVQISDDQTLHPNRTFPITKWCLCATALHLILFVRFQRIQEQVAICSFSQLAKEMVEEIAFILGFELSLYLCALSWLSTPTSMRHTLMASKTVKNASKLVREDGGGMMSELLAIEVTPNDDMQRSKLNLVAEAAQMRRHELALCKWPIVSGTDPLCILSDDGGNGIVIILIILGIVNTAYLRPRQSALQ